MRERPIGTIREWKMKRFTVRRVAYPDCDLDLSWDEDGSTLAGLESGEYMAFGAVCTVYLDGIEVGGDSLWGCIYEDLDKFQDHRECAKYNRELAAKGEIGRCGSYFAQLVSEAIKEARKTVRTMRSVHVRQ